MARAQGQIRMFIETCGGQRSLVFRFMIQDRGDRTFPEQLFGEAVAAQYRHQRRNVRAGRHPISRRSPEPPRESIPIGG